MNSRDRILLALNHKEADRVPFDLGACNGTGISIKANNALRNYLELPDSECRVKSLASQLADINEDLLLKLEVDTRGLVPRNPSNFQTVIQEEDKYFKFYDEWGIGWRMPKKGGLYYDMYYHPLAHCNNRSLERYKWPDGDDPGRINGLRPIAKKHLEAGYLVCFGQSIGRGFLHSGTHLVGFEDFFTDMILNPSRVDTILDKITEIKFKFWNQVLDNMGDLLDVVVEADDLGTQNGLLISPKMYRKYIKPRQKALFDFIKKKVDVKIFFHSCGSILELIPDFIDVGVDILNPIQVNADGMCTKYLKQQFGQDLVFWGGGIDTQRILPFGSPQEIREEVKKRIDDLAPGGGFVFSTVHNIQADVPPENIIAMWEALREYGVY